MMARIMLEKNTHLRLRFYKIKNKCKTFDTAIELLLLKNNA